MRLIGLCVAICLVLAALKAAAIVLALAIIAGIVLAALHEPKQTIGCLGGFMCWTLIGQYPVPSLFAFAAIAVAGTLSRVEG